MGPALQPGVVIRVVAPVQDADVAGTDGFKFRFPTGTNDRRQLSLSERFLFQTLVFAAGGRCEAEQLVVVHLRPGVLKIRQPGQPGRPAYQGGNAGIAVGRSVREDGVYGVVLQIA